MDGDVMGINSHAKGPAKGLFCCVYSTLHAQVMFRVQFGVIYKKMRDIEAATRLRHGDVTGINCVQTSPLWGQASRKTAVYKGFRQGRELVMLRVWFSGKLLIKSELDSKTEFIRQDVRKSSVAPGMFATQTIENTRIFAFHTGAEKRPSKSDAPGTVSDAPSRLKCSSESETVMLRVSL
jgi:hypothetical protein